MTTLANNTITKTSFNQSIFPINLLRSLGINSIHTSHYTVTDIDLLPSETLYDNFHKLPQCLVNDNHAIILYPAFVVNKDNFVSCREGGECNISYFLLTFEKITHRWDTLPRNKKQLKEQYDRNMTIQWPTNYYVYVFTRII